MERVIHQFPAHDDSEVSLVMVVDGGGPRIEWRRCRREAQGAMVAEDRFPIRLAWIPSLIEGLLRAEETLRDLEIEIEAGGGGTASQAPEATSEGARIIIVPELEGTPEDLEFLAGGPPQQPDPSVRVSGRYPRFIIRAPLIVAVQSRDLMGPRILTGDAVDISWGGLQAHLPAKLRPGTVLEILLGLGGKKALKLPARVVWGRAVEGLGQSKPHGLQFLPADPRLRELVERYLTLLAQGTQTEG